MPPTKTTTTKKPAAAKRATKSPPTAAAPAKRASKAPGPHMSPEHLRMNRILRILIAEQGCKQEEVAEALGVDPSVISKALKGDRSWKLEDLTGMAKFFDVKPAIWFGDPSQIANRLVQSPEIS